MTNSTTSEMNTAPAHGNASPEGGKPKKRGLLWLLFLIVIAAVAGYTLWQAGRPVQQQAQGKGGPGGGGGGGRGRGGFGPIPVAISAAAKSDVPVYLNGLGNVTAYFTVTVKSRVDGELQQVAVKEGDYVQAGQPLAKIDQRPFEVQLAQAQGTLARDQALLANAKLDQQRYRTLMAQDAITKQQLDTQDALVAQYEGTVKTDMANVDNAKLQIVYANITSPISGRVGLRLVDPGNIVHAADQNGMLVITQLQPISVLFTIPEDQVQVVMRKLTAGVKLSADAFNRDLTQKLATGQLLTVDNVIDQTTGTSKLKAIFDNKDNALFPNQFVNIRLLVDTLHGQIVVPTVAVQNGQQGTFVYAVDADSRVHIHPVKVGIQDQANTQILSGLDEGDKVVVDGTDRLQEGTQVRVRTPGDAGLDENGNPIAPRGQGKGFNKGGKGKKGDGNQGGGKQ